MKNKLFVWIFVLLSLVCSLIAFSDSVSAITPLEDSSGNGYTLTAQAGAIYDVTANAYNNTGASNRYLNTTLNNFIQNLTVSFAYRDSTNDFPDKKIQGLWFLGNGTGNRLISFVVPKNTSLSTYGRIQFSARNLTNSVTFGTSTNGYVVNKTSWTYYTITTNSTHILIYENGTYNQSVALAGGLQNVNVTVLQILADNPGSSYTNGSITNFTVLNKQLNATEVLQLVQGTYNGGSVVAKYLFTNTTCADTTPATNSLTSVSANTTICAGNYVNASFTIAAHNVVLDCSFSNFTFTVNSDVDWILNNNYDNVTVKDCFADGGGVVDIGVHHAYAKNFLLDNVNVHKFNVNAQFGDSGSDKGFVIINNSDFSEQLSAGSNIPNIYDYGSRLNIYNTHFDDSNTSHGFYFTPVVTQGDVNNSYIYNSTFNNNSNQGLHLNQLYAGYIANITILRSDFSYNHYRPDIGNGNGSAMGLDLNGCINCLFEDSTLHDNLGRGLSIAPTDNSTTYHTTNTLIKNNIFYNNGISDVIIHRSTNVSFVNNTYSTKPASGNFQIGSGSNSFSFDDNVFNGFMFYFDNTHSYAALANITYNYSGRATGSIYQNQFNATLTSPNNDIKNATNGVILASNVASYSVMLQAGQKIIVGDFVNDNYSLTVSFGGGSLANNSVQSRSYIFVNVSVNGTGFSNVTTSLYNVSGGVVATNYSVSNITLINYTGLSSGNYSIDAVAQDANGGSYSSGTRYFVLDTSVPVVTVSSPSTTTYTNGSILINFSASDAGVGVDKLWFYNGTGNTTYTVPYTLNLSDGSYSFIFYANDTLNNIGSSSVSFAIDITVPVVTVTSPSATSYSSGGVLINFSATDANNISQLWFFNGSGNTSYTVPYTLNLSDGSYSFIFYANDTLNNIGSASVSFTINYADAVVDCTDAADGAIAALGEFPLWLLIIFVIMAAAIIIGIMMSVLSKSNVSVDMTFLYGAIPVVLIFSIIVVLGIVILSTIC